MCGIAGTFNFRPARPVDRPELDRMVEHMANRGPDGSGVWFGLNGAIGLGHRRLSIIDLSETGAQPMASADGKTVIVFNGEIYNFRELRQELEAKGRTFRSTSDTEVLLHLYQHEGDAMLHRLRGMFAFAIWDDARKGLFLARDPFGIKPLYISNDGATFRFASQVKALLAGGRADTTPEPAGHAGFFIWGHVPEPYTLYRGIRALPAGTALWIDHTGAQTQKTFCSIPGLLRQAEGQGGGPLPGSPSLPSTLNSQPATLSAALRDTVRHHLIADVPVGVFLSSGVDSTTLAALAAERGGDLRTVTLGFEEFKGTANDEVPLAEETARRLGAAHQTVWVTREEFRAERDRLFAAMDQPSIDGVNTYFVSLAARRAGLKVALSGVGGDELFGGYPSFREIPRVTSAFQRFGVSAFQRFGPAFRAASAPLFSRLTSPKYASLLEYGGTYSGAYLLRRALHLPWELNRVMDRDLAAEGCRALDTMTRLGDTVTGMTSPRVRVSALESCWYMRNQLLRDSDWASMAHSLEIRVPLVDIQLLRSLLPILGSATPSTKQDLAATASSSLAASVLNRTKTGFTVPICDWLQADSEVTIYNSPAAIPPAKADQLATKRGLRGWASLVYSRLTLD